MRWKVESFHFPLFSPHKNNNNNMSDPCKRADSRRSEEDLPGHPVPCFRLLCSFKAEQKDMSSFYQPTGLARLGNVRGADLFGVCSSWGMNSRGAILSDLFRLFPRLSPNFLHVLPTFSHLFPTFFPPFPTSADFFRFFPTFVSPFRDKLAWLPSLASEASHAAGVPGAELCRGESASRFRAPQEPLCVCVCGPPVPKGFCVRVSPFFPFPFGVGCHHADC